MQEAEGADRPLSAAQIYASAIGEAMHRLFAAEHFLNEWQGGKGWAFLESSILQSRMALELVALASIAPDSDLYVTIRGGDLANAWHAKRIFRALRDAGVANPYPIPLTILSLEKAHLQFGAATDGFLTQVEFESLYDGLSDHLHAENPWRGDRGLRTFGESLPTALNRAKKLLGLHSRLVQKESDWSVIIVECVDASTVRVLVGEADGPFMFG